MVTPPEAEEPVLPLAEGRVDVEPPEEPMPERVLEDEAPPAPLGDEADDEPEGL